MQAQFVSVQEVRALYYSTLIETSADAYIAYLKAVSGHYGRSVECVGGDVGRQGVQGPYGGGPYNGGCCVGPGDSSVLHEGRSVAVHGSRECSCSDERCSICGGIGGDVGGGRAVEGLAAGCVADTGGSVCGYGSVEPESHDSDPGGAVSDGAVPKALVVSKDLPGPNVERNRIWREERKNAKRKARALYSGVTSRCGSEFGSFQALGYESVQRDKHRKSVVVTPESEYSEVDRSVVSYVVNTADKIISSIGSDLKVPLVFGDFVFEPSGPVGSVPLCEVADS